MDKLEAVLTFIAWPIGILSTLLVIGRFYYKMQYSDIERSLDRLTKGHEKIFPILTPSIVALICWAWVMT